MHPLIAAACTTGTALQKYLCAHPGDNTPAGRAGFEAGQAMGPVLIIVIIAAAVLLLASKRLRSGRPATA